MTYQARIPTNRADTSMTQDQADACNRVEHGFRLSEFQRGALAAAAMYSNGPDAVRAQRALDTDGKRRR